MQYISDEEYLQGAIYGNSDKIRKIEDRLQKLEDEVKFLKNFDDPYFKGLTSEQVLGLAKKSIRLTKENSELRHVLEDIYEVLREKDLCAECKQECCVKYSNKIKNILDKYINV